MAIHRRRGGGGHPCTPPPQTKVTIAARNEICDWESLVGPFLVLKLLGPRRPPPFLIRPWGCRRGRHVTRVRQVRRARKELDPTEPDAGRGLLLPSPGCHRGGYYQRGEGGGGLGTVTTWNGITEVCQMMLRYLKWDCPRSPPSPSSKSLPPPPKPVDSSSLCTAPPPPRGRGGREGTANCPKSPRHRRRRRKTVLRLRRGCSRKGCHFLWFIWR